MRKRIIKTEGSEKRPGILFILFLIMFVFVNRSAFSKEYLRTFYNYTQGLSQSQVYTIIEDHKGYLWAGTQYGLSRFNGYEFQNYYTQHGLPSSIIYVLDMDKEGNIWIGTGNGISKWNGKIFTKYTLKSEQIVDSRDIYIAEDGTIYYIAIDSWGKVESDHLIRLPSGAEHYQRVYTKITGNNKGEIFIGTGLEGVMKIVDGRIEKYQINRDSPPVSALFWDKKEDLLYIGTDDGLYKLKDRKITRVFTSEYIQGHSIKSISKSENGHLLLTIYDRGVFEFSEGKLKEKYYERRFLFNTFYQDSQRNIWVGTDGGGLIRLSESPFENISNASGIFNGYPMAITESPDGQIWVGTTRYGVFRFRSKNDKNPRRYQNYLGVDGNTVRSVIAEENGTIWFGTADGVVKYLNGREETFTVQDGLTHRLVRNIYKDHNQTLWISTDYGITLYEDGKFFEFRENDLFHHKSITQVLQDRKGDYLIATLGGLYKFDGQKLERYQPPNYPNDMQVETIFVDSSNNIWIGGVDGLALISSNGEFRRFGVIDGFEIGFIYFITEGNNGEIWIGTGTGLYRYDHNQFFYYTEQTGLVGTEANSRACMKDKEGRLWFGFLKGISIYKEIEKEKTPENPYVFIDEVVVDGEIISTDGKIELPHTVRDIFFRYHSVILSPGHNLQYKYFLEPLDDEWSSPTSQRYRRYSYLKPGHYRFKVCSILRYDQKGGKPTIIEFFIIPPIWMRWWFILASFVIVAGMCGLLVFLRIRRLHREKEALHLAVKERTMELEDKNKELESFAYTVSHDLKDPIGVIVGYTQVMEDFLEKQKVFGAKHFVEGIKRNSEKIVRFIDDLLQLSRSGRVVEKFIETNTKTIVNQIKKEMAEKEMLDPGFLRSGKLPKINADFDRLYLVFSNLITNAFKYRDRSRKLRISIVYEKQDDFHLFKIKDNGIGIDTKMAEEIFKPGVRLRTVDALGSGFGLRIIQKIIEAHGGKIWVESTPLKGSIFYFSIKDFPGD